MSLVQSMNSYREGFISVNDIRLHYLDWGGNGQTLVLVHAWGDSPYLFLDLAHHLKNKYRIISYSGRGHGKTEAPAKGYNIPQLAEDLRGLMDALEIKNSDLLGFSSAGNEITEFAIKYPERTTKLIYLEGGYDLTHELAHAALSNIPVSFIPGQADLSSVESYRNFIHNFWYAGEEWNELLEANFKAATKVNSDGTVTPVPDNNISEQVLQMHKNYYRQYSKINAPVLAIFASRFLISGNDPEMSTKYESWEKNMIIPWRQHSMDRIKNEIKNSTIKIIPGTSHTSIVYKKPKELIATINEFLESPVI